MWTAGLGLIFLIRIFFLRNHNLTKALTMPINKHGNRTHNHHKPSNQRIARLDTEKGFPVIGFPISEFAAAA